MSFYLSYNTYNKNTSGINFNINSRYTVETDTTCAVHYNPGGSNLTTKTMTSRTQVVSNITTALFGGFPLYVTLYPKETSSKFLFLTLGSCSGILTLFGDILGIILHLPLNYKYDLHSHLLDVLLL